MGSPELRAQTASERLTLAEEYQMQRDWMTQDDSKVELTVLRNSILLLCTAHRGNVYSFEQRNIQTS